MSKFEVPAELISQLAAKMESEPLLQKQLNALLGIQNSSQGEPAPKEAPLPDVSTTPRSTPVDKQELDAAPRPELSESSDMLSLVPEVYLPRKVKYQHNFFVPNLTAMFFILNTMDRYIVRKFKARRAATLLAPTMNIVYFAELVCYQVLRCLSFAGYLKNADDQQFLDTLLKRYPPEILPIPGYLLPFFKSITTYLVQNKQHERVCPDFPSGILNTSVINNDYHWINQNEGTQHFPIVPLLLSVAFKFQEKVNESTAPKASVFTSDNWPLGKFKTTGTTTEYQNQPDFGYYKFPQDTATWSAYLKSAVSSPGLRHKTVVTKDIIQNLTDDNVLDYNIPEPSDLKKIKTIQDFMVMKDLTWFKSFLGPLANYAKLFNGSGTLADCSVDGPAVGAYIFTYTGTISPSTSLADGPVTMLDDKAVFEMIGQLRTTEGLQEPVTERLAALTQINSRLPKDHFFKATNVSATSRNGNVWAQRPIYGPTVEHEELEAFAGSTARFVQKVFDA